MPLPPLVPIAPAGLAVPATAESIRASSSGSGSIRTPRDDGAPRLARAIEAAAVSDGRDAALVEAAS